MFKFSCGSVFGTILRKNISEQVFDWIRKSWANLLKCVFFWPTNNASITVRVRFSSGYISNLTRTRVSRCARLVGTVLKGCQKVRRPRRGCGRHEQRCITAEPPKEADFLKVHRGYGGRGGEGGLVASTEITPSAKTADENWPAVGTIRQISFLVLRPGIGFSSKFRQSRRNPEPANSPTPNPYAQPTLRPSRPCTHGLRTRAPQKLRISIKLPGTCSPVG